ncbi:ABC transporter substrate-binding protein [Pseudomonas typographi]|nr:ABC transporter substrate-binding protein [Pseudomonas typographi]
MRVGRVQWFGKALAGCLLFMSLAAADAGAADTGPPVVAGGSTGTRQVIDDSGRAVSVPAEPMRLADAWFAHHVLLMTLGAGPRIVATVNHPRSLPWMFKVLPSLNNATGVEGTTFNAEALLAAGVDLVFTSTADRQALAYQQVGLAVMRMGYTDLPGLQRSMLATAQALGGTPPMVRAHAYNQYLDQQLAFVAGRVATVPAEQRPRVLHIASVNPLKVDGSGTLIDDWIKIAGGRNAATGLKGNLQVVSAEQLLVWQPDVLILAAGAGDLKQAAQAQLLSQLTAVQRGWVLRNPAGVFPWDRYGTEVALQIEWAAQQLHPALFRDVDMVQQTMGFYQRFFDYALSEADAQRILQALPPAP